MHEKLIILDFGSQTTQLIGRRVRELNMYCEIVPYNKFPHDATDVKGVILSGSPYSVYDENAFKADLTEIRGKYPVLGICYGAQFLAYTSGGNVEPANSREYGRANLSHIDGEDELLKGIHVGSQIWMSHGDTITVLPDKFKVIASTDDVRAAAYHVEGEQTWGVQFHPEVFHSTDGTKLLDNFLNICGCAKDWTPASFIPLFHLSFRAYNQGTFRQEEIGNLHCLIQQSSPVTAKIKNKGLRSAVFQIHDRTSHVICSLISESGKIDIPNLVIQHSIVRYTGDLYDFPKNPFLQRLFFPDTLQFKHHLFTGLPFQTGTHVLDILSLHIFPVNCQNQITRK